MATIQTYPWDAAEHLETKEDIAAYLEAALEDGDPSLTWVTPPSRTNCLTSPLY